LVTELIKPAVMNRPKLFSHPGTGTYIPGFVILSLLFLFSCQSGDKSENDFSKLINFTGQQLELLMQNTEKILSSGANTAKNGRPLVVPRNLNEDGSLRLIPSRDWVSGFFPGSLWFMYQYTGLAKWKSAAEKYTAPLEQEKFTTTTHDLGFMMGCSFGKGYALTGNPAYREILIQSAKSLITRFNPTIGAIRSWDHNTDKWQYPVIIDNMMNLELLFWASKETGDSVYADIAIKHARTTLNNHFRENFSSYHVIDYDSLTGTVLNRHTHQGLHHGSAWARGQAWGLYGYTMTYRETGLPEFLEVAERIADFILNHPNLPPDLIPFWDFDIQDIKNEPRDVSASAIIASALFELGSFIPGKKDFYHEKASHILKSLASDYLSAPGENQGFVLMHSTGHKPNNSEVDVPIIYAEYYFLEALGRQHALASKSE
jgi:unsaturated chondroitin disaccharide hydrolase